MGTVEFCDRRRVVDIDLGSSYFEDAIPKKDAVDARFNGRDSLGQHHWKIEILTHTTWICSLEGELKTYLIINNGVASYRSWQDNTFGCRL